MSSISLETFPANPPGPPLLEREGPWSALKASLKLALEGRLCGLLIEGDQGLGKTVLVDALLDAVRPLGIQSHMGLGLEGSAAAPEYALWGHVLDLVALSGPPQQSEAARGCLNKIRAKKSEPEIMEALTHWALRECDRHPMVLILEDLHIADLGSLKALQYLLSRGNNARLMIVATLRATDLRSMSSPHSQAIARIRQHLQPVLLQPLSVGGSSALLTQVLGEEIPPFLAPDLHRRSAGNPLFLREWAFWLAGSGIPRTEEEWARTPTPRRVMDCVLERIEKQPAEIRQILDVAAVEATCSGGRFMLGTLRRILESEVERLRQLLKSTTDSQIVKAESELNPGVYIWNTQLQREAVYESLTFEARRRLHGSLADAYREREGAGESIDPVVTLEHTLRGSTRDNTNDAVRAALEVLARLSTHQIGPPERYIAELALERLNHYGTGTEADRRTLERLRDTTPLGTDERSATRRGLITLGGDVLSIEFRGERSTYKVGRGLLYLACLLRHPDEPLSAEELYNMVVPSQHRVTLDPEERVLAALREAGIEAHGRGDFAEAVADRESVQTYMRGIQTAVVEIEKLRQLDPSNPEIRTLVAKKKRVERELSRIIHRGRIKRIPNQRSRLIDRLDKGIKRALQKVHGHQPDLSDHLRRGYRREIDYFWYQPSPGESWRVHL